MTIMRNTTHLAVPVFAESVEVLRDLILAAIEKGATLIELRLDMCGELSDDDVRSAVANLPEYVELLLTNRSSAEGGESDASDTERLSRIDRLAPAFDMIDLELRTWQASESHRTLMAEALSRASERKGVRSQSNRRRLVMSMHDFRGRPKALQSDLLACVEAPLCDVVKVAWPARSVRDCFEVFDIMQTCPKPVIAICMGELGVVSRILAPKFNAFASFANLTPERATAPGQLSIDDFRGIYRWDSMVPEMAVFGVIGHPIGHSRSPAAHNAVFAGADFPAVYVPLDVAPGYESLKALLLEVESRPALGFRGFSVTIPHKADAMRFLRECGGQIDEVATRVGAVNTLGFDSNSGWRGTNTDYRGAIAAISSGLEMQPEHLAGLRVLVLGAGGVSRAVVASLVDHGADVCVSNRSADRAEGLVEKFGVRATPWDQRAGIPTDLIVNCTSVGMTPDVDASAWPGPEFPGKPAVVDTVYSPPETRMLREAKSAGCRVVSGLTMFATQAAAQWEFWMNASVDVSAYTRALGATETPTVRKR